MCIHHPSPSIDRAANLHHPSFSFLASLVSSLHSSVSISFLAKKKPKGSRSGSRSAFIVSPVDRQQEPQLPPPISSWEHRPSLGISPYFLVLEQPLNPEFPDLFCFASSSLCCPPAAMWV
ncbi:hypothetical protein SLEP1_g13206 [Rubroshorea leprosula]|uniref:Uncharacterized protein n=1 Tax=Rubroshorea leprosula TaxID=152421 RepID=A0AAV5IF25_9ROSI|nr:hypothetical protein SLEP1_g13206 [Rubroshorea leprosula]